MSLNKTSTIKANQPDKSIWVSANAGSGKTSNLVNRVSRLLLLGVRPEKILCLTYTTAAANEMHERLIRELGYWSMMSNEGLYQRLTALSEGLYLDEPNKSKLLTIARQLFAKVLETPGGLKIQTIHSFSGSVLRKFPLEVNISPNFSVLDDRQKSAIIDETISYIAKKNSATLEKLVSLLKVSNIDHVIDLIFQHRQKFETKFDLKSFCNCFDLNPQKLSLPQALEKILEGVPKNIISLLQKSFSRGSKLELEQAEKLKEFDNVDVEAKLQILENVLFTKEGKARSLRNYPSKIAKSSEPHLENLISTLQSNFKEYISHRNESSLIEKTQILYEFASVFLKIYEGFKTVDNALDYDDLILKTNILLTDYRSKWVQYKLDGGIDHILLDETQDTSRAQWVMLTALMDDFFVDDRITKGLRTFYAVGDEKQSIYSFQGARVDDFSYMREFFAEKMALIGDRLHEVSLLKSFRSSKAILNFVDEVFKNGGDTGVKSVSQHIAYHERLPGKVELWPLIKKSKTEVKINWWNFEKNVKEPSSYYELAENIGLKVKRLLESDNRIFYVDPKNKILEKRISPGDFLILVRSRGPLYNELFRAFDKYKVPTTGSDRLYLLDDLAIRDVISLLKFLDNPLDDLSLAEALKSPLFGVTEQLLFQICHKRKNTLYHSLITRFPEHDASKILEDLLYQVRRVKPYDLVKRIFVKHRGRLKITARFGTAVNEVLDELLEQILNYEDLEPPSVFGFLEWIKNFDHSIKRQSSTDRDKIRIMTIHGAKGLESPIVILGETTEKVRKRRNFQLLRKDNWLCISEREELLPNSVIAIKNEQTLNELKEENRLFYVAITRAKSWLIMCGIAENKLEKLSSSSTLSWYERSRLALSNLNFQSENLESSKLIYELVNPLDGEKN